MMSSKFLMTFFFALTTLLALVASLPVPLDARDVWVPTITSPDASTVWVIGHSYNVTWDTSNQPSQITNYQGKIYLVHDNLIDFSHELASNFNITQGWATIQVPCVAPGVYQIDLFGDSGDWSQNFTITA